MKIKPGLCELAVAVALCAVSVSDGRSWEAGLYLAGCLMAFAIIPLLVLNHYGLPAMFRATLLNCVVLPYSTFLVVLPRVLMLPLAERLLDEPETPPAPKDQ